MRHHGTGSRADLRGLHEKPEKKTCSTASRVKQPPGLSVFWLTGWLTLLPHLGTLRESKQIRFGTGVSAAALRKLCIISPSVESHRNGVYYCWAQVAHRHTPIVVVSEEKKTLAERGVN